jgi:hypothetical protein
LPAAAKPADRAAAMATMKSCGIDVDELDRAMRVAQLDKQKSLEELWPRVDRDVQTLAKALDDGKVPVPWPAAEPSTEHWWVRIDSGDLDPTLAQAGAKETGVWAVKDIPAAEFHTIIFREVIVANGKPETVLEAKYRACDLFGKAVTFANLAMDWQQKAAKSPTPSEALGSLKDNRRFRASICVEDKGTPGKVFDVDGQILKDDGSQIGGAKALGGGLGGLFGGGGEDKPQSKLDACRLEVEIAAPGDKTPMVVRRSLLRPGGSAAQKVYDLCTTYEFLAMPEDVSEALIVRKVTETFEKLGQWLKDCGDKDPLADGGHRKIARLNGEVGLRPGAAERGQSPRADVQPRDVRPPAGDAGGVLRSDDRRQEPAGGARDRHLLQPDAGRRPQAPRLGRSSGPVAGRFGYGLGAGVSGASRRGVP